MESVKLMGVSFDIQYSILNPRPQREKTCLRRFANNTGADYPGHPRSLISTFVIRLLESSIFKLAFKQNFNNLAIL